MSGPYDQNEMPMGISVEYDALPTVLDEDPERYRCQTCDTYFWDRWHIHDSALIFACLCPTCREIARSKWATRVVEINLPKMSVLKG